MASEEKFIEEMFEKGILVNKELLNKEVDQSLLSKVQAEGDIIVLNEDYINVLKGQTTLVDWYEIDRYRVEAEKERDEDLYQSQLQQLGHSNLTLQNAFATTGITSANYTICTAPKMPVKLHAGILYGSVLQCVTDQDDPLYSMYHMKLAEVMSDSKRLYVSRIYNQQIHNLGEEYLYRY